MVWSDNVKKFFGIVKLILITCLCFGVVLFCAYSDTHYVRTGYIKHKYKNLYTFTDSKGHIWEFIDDSLLIPTDRPIEAEVKMFTNNTTDYIKDDIILDYKILSISENEN